MHTNGTNRLLSANRENDAGCPVHRPRTHPDLFDDAGIHDFLMVNPRPDLLQQESVFHDRRHFGIDYP